MLNGWQYLNPGELERIERGIVENRAHGGPFHIELHPTNLCNLDCFFCVSRSGRHGESLAWPVLRECLVRGRHQDVRMLRLAGGGEPLAYPQIRELIELCGEQGILFENITTNGTLLAPLVPALVQAGLAWVTVSLNDADPARYAAMMRAPERRFHEAVDGIRAAVAARDRLPPDRRHRIWIQYFLWKGSAPHIVRMYEFARALGVDTIYFRTLFSATGHELLEERERDMVERQLSEIIRVDAESKEYRLHLDLSQELGLHHFSYREQGRHNPPFSENYPDFRHARPRTEYCFVGWYTCSINALGVVYPCMQYHQMPEREMGNIHDEPLDAIWRGPRFRAYRRQVHGLMRLRGRMEPSLRFNRYVEKKCTECDLCHYVYNLATPDFYQSVAQKVRRQTSAVRTLCEHLRNAAIWASHRALHRPR